MDLRSGKPRDLCFSQCLALSQSLCEISFFVFWLLVCALYAAVEGLRYRRMGWGGVVITCRKAESHGIYSAFCAAPLVLHVGLHGCLSVERGRLPGFLRVKRRKPRYLWYFCLFSDDHFLPRGHFGSAGLFLVPRVAVEGLRILKNGVGGWAGGGGG